MWKGEKRGDNYHTAKFAYLYAFWLLVTSATRAEPRHQAHRPAPEPVGGAVHCFGAAEVLLLGANRNIRTHLRLARVPQTMVPYNIR